MSVRDFTPRSRYAYLLSLEAVFAGLPLSDDQVRELEQRVSQFAVEMLGADAATTTTKRLAQPFFRPGDEDVTAAGLRYQGAISCQDCGTRHSPNDGCPADAYIAAARRLELGQ